MFSRFDARSSFNASSLDSVRRAGCWTVKAGRALSLHARRAGVLEIAQGRAWVTISPVAAGQVADWVLVPGSSLHVPAGAHVVMESWALPGAPQQLAFRWDGVASSSLAWDIPTHKRRSVAQSRRELTEAARRGLTGLSQAASAAGDVTCAAVRLAWGLLAWRGRRECAAPSMGPCDGC